MHSGAASASAVSGICGARLVYTVNVDWFFVSHRLALARAARQSGLEVHLATTVTDARTRAKILAEGIQLHEIKFNRSGINPLSELRTVLSIFRLYRRLDPDIVHHITIKPVVYGGIAARMGGVRSVVSTISGLGYAFSGSSVLAAFRKWFTLRLYQLALRHRRSLVIFQNLENEALFLRSGAINKNQSRLIPGSGVDIDLFQFKPESPGEPCVVLASRMLADKGVASFVEAARRLRSQGVFAKFLLVGDIDHGNPASLTRNQLLDWSTSGAVTWLGHSNDMVNILRDCHIVCLPAVFGEGLPKVLLEAACSGRAIVTTDVPGCRDIGVHEENALVVPPGDTDALAAALKLLLDSPELRRRFGAAGRRLVEERFKQSLIIEKTLAVYTELLADA